MMDLNDTIVAIASASGGAVRGAVRLSGPRSIEIANALAGEQFPNESLCPTAIGFSIQLGEGRVLPATFFVWPGAKSYTREPTVEIHTLGSPPLLDLVVRLACRHGARLANAGEFTLRAFLAGRLDLTQAEAVLGVIDATTDKALQIALKQLAGGLAAPLGGLREQLLLLLADLEAGLDFADEDIEFISPEGLAQRLGEIHNQIDALAVQLKRRAVNQSLPRVVLCGATNAGKSSLFNAIVARFGTAARKIAAIESPQPGATRDYLKATLEIHGIECELIDTAGYELSEGSFSPVSSAQGLASAMRDEATLLLHCHDSTTRDHDPLTGGENLLQILTKGDACPELAQTKTGLPQHNDAAILVTSAVTGVGLDHMAACIAERLADDDSETLIASTAERSRESLRTAQQAIAQAESLAATQASEELVAAELRSALDELGQVAGMVYTDDVLDRVFSRFCIGK